jgi:hypothetical protein
MASGDHLGPDDDGAGDVGVADEARDGALGAADAEKAPPPTLFVWMLTLAATISGLLFGCECGRGVCGVAGQRLGPRAALRCRSA